MLRVTRDNVTQNDLFTVVTEASDIGLKPGEWPSSLETNLGNGQPFVFVSFSGNQDSASYRQASGVLCLIVLND